MIFFSLLFPGLSFHSSWENYWAKIQFFVNEYSQGLKPDRHLQTLLSHVFTTPKWIYHLLLKEIDNNNSTLKVCYCGGKLWVLQLDGTICMGSDLDISGLKCVLDTNWIRCTLNIYFLFLPVCSSIHQSKSNLYSGSWSTKTKFSFLLHCQEIHPKV